ncbi:hypothetical protein [Nocardia otitidiscaviarum]|uniref:hypothetical protein n=1 Tax=Nocardia otitidiscaviarum TaxID=1823 RepID=UPI0011DD8B97|nr:hypothetical protein [Nocardia otitidiscaviarum]
MIGLDWTGVEVRCLREAMLCDYSKFAERIGCSERAVGKWESKGLHANLQPSSKRQLEDAYKRLDPAECQRFESALAGAGRIPAAAPLPARTRVVLAPDRPADLLSAVDGVRLVVDQTLAQCTVSPARVSLLDERVAQRVHEYTAMPPATALARIAPDLLEVQTIAAERQPATVQARLSEQSAVLGLLTADALMKLGEIDRASYWFGTARLAADDTPNLRLRARVRAQHAMLPYYYGDVATSVSLARKAQAILSDTTSDEAALAAAAEARALARLGDRQGAELAMNKAQRTHRRARELRRRRGIPVQHQAVDAVHVWNTDLHGAHHTRPTRPR